VRESSKPLYISIEGLDGSGKTTIFRALDAATGHQYLISDRDTLSIRMFNRFRDQTVDETSLQQLDLIHATCCDFYVVFLDTPPLTCYYRKHDWPLWALERQREIFLDLLKYTPATVIRIEGSAQKTVDEVVQEIVRKIWTP
jgi:thymidylate kinase